MAKEFSIKPGSVFVRSFTFGIVRITVAEVSVHAVVANNGTVKDRVTVHFQTETIRGDEIKPSGTHRASVWVFVADFIQGFTQTH